MSNSKSSSRSYFVELHAQCADEATIVVSYGKIHTWSGLNQNKFILGNVAQSCLFHMLMRHVTYSHAQLSVVQEILHRVEAGELV